MCSIHQTYILILICSFCISLYGDKFGPDPWEQVSKTSRSVDDLDEQGNPFFKRTVLDSNSCPCREECDTGSWFYKRILNFILKNGKFKDSNDGFMEGLLHFKIRVSNFKDIKQLILLESKLTEDDYRKGNEFIMEALVQPSFVEEKILSKVVTLFTENYMYLVNGLIAGLGVILFWWAIKRIHFNSRFFIVSGCILLFVWEIIIFYKENEEKLYLQLTDELQSCSSYLYFWKSECHVSFPSVSDWWRRFHPGIIILRIFTKLVTNPLSWFLEDVVKKLSNEFMWPVNKIVYIILSMSTIVTLLYTALSFLANVVFGTPLKMNILFNLMNLSLGQTNMWRNSSRRERSSSNTDNTDRLSGENLRNMLQFSSNLLENLRQASIQDATEVNNPCSSRPIKRKVIGQRRISKAESTGRVVKKSLSKMGIFAKIKQEVGDGDAKTLVPKA